MRNLSRSKEAPCAEKLLADLLPYIGTPIASAISERYGKRVSALCEIRFVLQRPVTVEFSDGFEVLSDRNARPVIADFECVNRVVNAVSDGSLYSINETIKDGFVTIEGGHRIGFCGTAVIDGGAVSHIKDISAVCVRICREVLGCAERVRDVFFLGGRAANVLIASPPGCGKTTVLRDAAKRLAGMGFRVAVCDEREELFPKGAAQPGIDVMRGADKAAAVQMLLRTMSPQVILCDEIGDMRDVQALEDAARCGVGLIATAHAGTLDDVLRRPALRKLHDAAAFESYLLLGRHGKLEAAADARLLKEEKADVGCGGDGDDLLERHRFCGGRRRNAAGALGAGDAPLHDADERCDSL